MSKKNTISTIKTLAGCLAAMMTLAGMPFFSASAADTPALSIKSVTVQEEDIAESRNVGVELVISNNQKGFRAGSFGIHYDESLNYTNARAIANAGDAFEVVCNPEEHLLWFVGASSSEDTAASALIDESVLTLYFDIAEDVNGGDFALDFVWSGLDGSEAYWYADTQTNLIAEVSSGSSNGMIRFFNPDSEALNYTDLQLNPDAQAQLQVANASGTVFWFSSTPEIATVDENGVVSAVAPGVCQIQAFINNHILACNVTVLDAYHYDITDSTEVEITSEDTIVVLEYPEAEEPVTWVSATPDVATVNENGEVHALKDGTANILATCKGKTYMKTITVHFSKSSKPSEEVKSGDIDNNGNIDILDVIMLNKAVLGKEILTETQLKAADLNGNGSADAEDSLRLMKTIVGLD